MLKRLPKNKNSIAITSITITITRRSQDDHKTKQDIGRAGYGFEKSSSGCCASRQSKDNYKS